MEIKYLKTHPRQMLRLLLEADVVLILLIVIFSFLTYRTIMSLNQKISQDSVQGMDSRKKFSAMNKQYNDVNKQYLDLKSQDQYVINKNLEGEIQNIHDTYLKSETSYQNLVDLKIVSKDTKTEDVLFAKALDYLSQKNYASADATLNTLNAQIDADNAKIAASLPANVPSSNAPPTGGFSVQQVQSDVGSFTVSIIAADLGSTRIIVDTASDSDCPNNCPVLPLATYVARNGAYAGINGSYFCPTAYPSCAGKTNSFDLLVMNKNKHYFNSDNNVYSTNPAVIFGGSYIRFVGRALEWGRDTGVDGVLSNFPFLVQGNQIVYGGTDDPKFVSKGPRGFVASKGNTVYIGFVYNATMSDSAHVLKSLGMENAMNLDEGGSTAP